MFFVLGFILVAALLPGTASADDTVTVSVDQTAVSAPEDDGQANLVNDDCTIPTGCGAWPTDPTTPTGSTGGTLTCGKKTSYEACLKVCTCEYNNLKKKCNNGIACLHAAQKAKDVCDTGCLTDFAP